MKYLDLTGLSYFFSKIKTLLSNKTTVNRSLQITTAEITDNSQIIVPMNYQVGNNSLAVYVMGEKLVKADPSSSVDGNYIEVGNTGSVSTTIQLYNIGQSIPIGTPIEFIVYGNY